MRRTRAAHFGTGAGRPDGYGIERAGGEGADETEAFKEWRKSGETAAGIQDAAGSKPGRRIFIKGISRGMVIAKSSTPVHTFDRSRGSVIRSNLSPAHTIIPRARLLAADSRSSKSITASPFSPSRPCRKACGVVSDLPRPYRPCRPAIPPSSRRTTSPRGASPPGPQDDAGIWPPRR